MKIYYSYELNAKIKLKIIKMKGDMNNKKGEGTENQKDFVAS